MVDRNLNSKTAVPLDDHVEGNPQPEDSLAAQLMRRHQGFGRHKVPTQEFDPISFRQIKLNPLAMNHAGEPISFKLSVEQAETLRSHIFQQAILNDLKDSDPLKADLIRFLEDKPGTTLMTGQHVSLSKILSQRSSNPKDSAILNSIADLLVTD